MEARGGLSTTTQEHHNRNVLIASILHASHRFICTCLPTDESGLLSPTYRLFDLFVAAGGRLVGSDPFVSTQQLTDKQYKAQYYFLLCCRLVDPCTRR